MIEWVKKSNRQRLRGLPAEDRFWLQTAPCPITGCWFWVGACINKGYGVMRINGKNVGAHRFSWELANGKIPAGMFIDHYACENPNCVNPDHLRPASNRENILRGDTPASRNLAKRCCPKCGGEYTMTNKGTRKCQACITSKQRSKRLAERTANARASIG